MAARPTDIERFSDDEAAFLRHVRFGELPSRVRPEDLVETTETDPPHGPSEIDPLTNGLVPWAAG
jgi:hypothetical protein